MTKKRNAQPVLPPAWVEPGAIVNYHAIIGGPPTLEATKIRTAPWQLGSGDWVVAVEGKAGGVSLEALTLVCRAPLTPPPQAIARQRAMAALAAAGAADPDAILVRLGDAGVLPMAREEAERLWLADEFARASIARWATVPGSDAEREASVPMMHAWAAYAEACRKGVAP